MKHLQSSLGFCVHWYSLAGSKKVWLQPGQKGSVVGWTSLQPALIFIQDHLLDRPNWLLIHPLVIWCVVFDLCQQLLIFQLLLNANWKTLHWWKTPSAQIEKYHMLNSYSFNFNSLSNYFFLPNLSIPIAAPDPELERNWIDIFQFISELTPPLADGGIGIYNVSIFVCYWVNWQ